MRTIESRQSHKAHWRTRLGTRLDTRLRPLMFGLVLGAIAVAGAAPFSAVAQDTLLKNREDWRALSPAERTAYAMAVFDKSLMAVYGVTWTVAFAEGLEACRAERAFTAANVAEATTAAYDRPNAMPDMPPLVIINSVLNDLCRDYIKAANARHGLK